jgi:hypothetical protein
MSALREAFSMVTPPGDQVTTGCTRMRMPSADGGLAFTEATSKVGTGWPSALEISSKFAANTVRML